MSEQNYITQHSTSRATTAKSILTFYQGESVDLLKHGVQTVLVLGTILKQSENSVK